MRNTLIIFCLLSSLFAFSQDTDTTSIYDETYSFLKREYPLFSQRDYYDLDFFYQKYRGEALKNANEDSTMEFTCKMIKNLEDFHTRIYMSDGMCWAVHSTDWHKTFNSEKKQNLFWRNSDSTLYKYGFNPMIEILPAENSFGNGNKNPMFRYTKKGEIGYLNPARFETKEGRENDDKNFLIIAKEMDSLVKYMNGIEVLIVDMRSCLGGWPIHAETMFSRLTSTRRKYATGVFFENAHDSLSPIELFVNPGGEEQLNVPILILTNKVARSSAEYFILMLRTLPDVYSIGAPTWGAFAGSKVYTLSNGAELQYSSEKIYDQNGVCFEGKGIPVDQHLENGWDDIENKEDKVILKALEYIRLKK
jgi:hypothetical protein